MMAADLLNHKNAEVPLIGAHRDVEKELGITLDSEKETTASADIFRELRLDRKKHRLAPLTKGEFQ